MDLEGYRMAVQQQVRWASPEDRCRPPSLSTLHDSMNLVGARAMMPVLEAYQITGTKHVPGGRQEIMSALRCQLTAFLLGAPCETWIGLDVATVNAVCWFVTHAPREVLAEAVLQAHRTQPIPHHRQDAFQRFLRNTPVRLIAQA